MSDRRQYPMLWSLISFAAFLSGNHCRWEAAPLYLDNGHERICAAHDGMDRLHPVAGRGAITEDGAGNPKEVICLVLP